MGFVDYSLPPGGTSCETGGVTITPSATVAAFDLDGTLSDGGSVFKWLRYLRGSRATYAAAARLALPLLVGAVRSGRWADRAKERLFGRLLRGLDQNDVRERSREFALEHFEEHGRPDVLARLRSHLREGHDVVIVSASPQIYVDVVVEMFDADGGLGTRLAVDARGTLTGSYLGKNCRGREKARRLAEWTEARFGDAELTVYAYGNSRGDRRLLRMANFPFNVGRLGPFGALRHFPRLSNDEVVSPTADE
jgi:phosphatidylglycerophosphatase C